MAEARLSSVRVDLCLISVMKSTRCYNRRDWCDRVLQSRKKEIGCAIADAGVRRAGVGVRSR